MSFVPVTGPATFRAGDPPREGVVEFSDDRRTVALPIRAALPVLTRAHARDDLHPSVALLSGAALLGHAAGRGRQVRARPAGPAGGSAGARRRRPRPGRDARPGPGPRGPRRGRPRAGARGARRGGRRDAAHRAARPAAARRRRAAAAARTAVDPDFTRRLQARSPSAVARPTTAPSWSPSRCGSRPTRRSWSPARCGWSCRCTTRRTRCTSATPPLLWTEAGPAQPRLRRPGPHPRHHRAARGRRGLAGARPAARAAGARPDHPRHRRAGQPARRRRARRSTARASTCSGRAPRPRPDRTRRCSTGPAGAPRGAAATGLFGPDALFAFRWQVALHGDPLTDEEMDAAGRARSPLIQLRGNWTVVDPAVAQRPASG